MLRTLVNMNPVAELRHAAEMMDRTFGDLKEYLAEDQPAGWTLPVDIFEREKKLYVKAAVPGVKPEDLDLTVQDNILTIKGEIGDESAQNDVVYRREHRYGSFIRSIRLPEDVDANAIEAEFDHGFVTVAIPRVEPPKPQSLKINVKRAESNKAFEANAAPSNGAGSSEPSKTNPKS